MNFRFKKIRYLLAVLLSMMFLACTDKKVDEPFVLNLVALPNEITISEAYFYPKPFSVRATYSNNTEKNISSRVIWRSENSALIRINQKGEIEKTGECEQIKCIVSLIATDPESGQSLRFTINIIQKKAPLVKEKITKNTPTTALKNKSKVNKEDEDIGDTNEQVNETSEETIKPDSVTDESIPFILGGNDSVELVNGADVINGTSLNNLAEAENEIDSVFFESQSVSLVSGEAYFPRIMSLDNVGKERLMRAGYECYAFDNLNASVMVLSPCQLVAARPGKSEIGVRLMGDKSVLTGSQVFVVDVLPEVVLSATTEGMSYLFDQSNHNVQKWLEIPGLQVMDYYRVQLLGNIPYGQRISVYANSESSLQVCMNSAPMNVEAISCYFKVLVGLTRIAIEPPDLQQLNAELKITRADPRLFNNTEKQNSTEPALITLNAVINDFIMANETGLNNRHFYEFPFSVVSNFDLLVTLSNYDADIQLIVKGGGACRDVKKAQDKTLKRCRIVDYDGSKVLITINGNSDKYRHLNKSTVEQGGTPYELLLEKIE